MNATILTPKASPPRPTARRWADVRLIPRIETFPQVVSFAQTVPGKVVLLAAFGLELWFFAAYPTVMQLLLPLALITFMPEYRRFVLALAPLCLVLVQGDPPLLVGMRLLVVATGILLFWIARRWPKSWFGQRPIVFLLSGFSLLILLGCAATPHTSSYKIIWTLIEVMAAYVWFIGYALMDRSARPRADTSLELASFRPLWGSTATPFPKGAAYLRRIEAQNPEQLAIVQLKGLKLLVVGDSVDGLSDPMD